MAGGSYDVNEDPEDIVFKVTTCQKIPEHAVKTNIKNDESFKSCICTMLVFLGICLLIVIITIPMKVKQWRAVEKNYMKQNKDYLHENMNDPHQNKDNTDHISTEKMVITTTKYKELITPDPRRRHNWEEQEPPTILIEEFHETTMKTIKHQQMKKTSLPTHIEEMPSTSPTHIEEIPSTLPTHIEENTEVTSTISNIETNESSILFVTTEDNNKTLTTEVSIYNDDITTLIINTTESTFSDITHTYLRDKYVSDDENVSTVSTIVGFIETHPTTFVDNTTKTSSVDKTTNHLMKEINSSISSTSDEDYHNEYNNETIDETTTIPTILINTNQQTSLSLKTKRKTEHLTDQTILEKTTTPLPSILSLFKQQKPVCQHVGCKFISARILSKINHEVDPCEDFYGYACGNYNFDNDLEDTYIRIKKEIDDAEEKSPRYLKQFKNVFENCVKFHEDFDYSGRVTKAKKIFESVSRCYDRKQTIPKKLTTTELVKKLLFLDISPLFEVNVDIDKKTKNFVFQVNLGKRNEFLNNDETPKQKKKCFHKAMKNSRYLKNVNLTTVYEKYVICQLNFSDYIKSVEKALNIFDVFPHLDAIQRTEQIKEILITIELYILKSLEKLPTRSDMRQIINKKKYTVTSMGDLQKQYPFIKWCTLFSKLYGEYIEDQQRVQLYFEDYFDDLFKMLNDMPQWKLHNAIMAMFAEELFTSLVQPKNVKNIPKYCLKQTTNLLQRESTAIYLNTWPETDITSNLNVISETFEQLKTNLSTLVNNSEWLDVNSKESIQEKIHKLEIVSDGMLDGWRNDSFMDKFSGTGNFSDYQSQVFHLIQINRNEIFSLWNESAMNKENIWWQFVPNFNSKPKSLFTIGKILVPLHTILKLPKNVPKYVKLAMVDYPIAKEIAHQFDSTGITYLMKQPNVIIKNPTYHEMTTCGINKYSYPNDITRNGKYYSFMLDGKLSLDARIAEDSAITLIEHTSSFVINEPLLPFVSDSFSREKIMYLILAQEHCKKPNLFDEIINLFESEHIIPALLTRNYLSNSRRFSSTYDCKEGSNMHPEIKCQAFPQLSAYDDEPQAQYEIRDYGDLMPKHISD